MSLPDLVKDAERQMMVCNACRYCEGYCAVFPAMAQRRRFGEGDLIYLANLCFDCRDCYEACQYAPPHEFAINIPKVMAELRTRTYREFTWPSVLGGLFTRRGAAVVGATAVALALVAALALTATGPDTLFRAHAGEGAFFRVVPYAAMTVPAALLVVFGLGVLATGVVRFAQRTGAGLSHLIDTGAFWGATRDALGLAYLKGGGAGCAYPNRSFSSVRRWFHHLVFYGFALDVASTSVAAFYHHILDRQAPYPLWSVPVVLGTLGGVALVIGAVGLLLLKLKAPPDLAASAMRSMDVAFLTLLLLTSLTGLLLLALRESAVMGVLLVIHLGMVAGLFVAIPYGKFVHVGYRYVALLRNAGERAKR